jgi:hypothetical protein
MLLSFAYLAFRAVLRLDRHNNAHHLTGRGPPAKHDLVFARA